MEDPYEANFRIITVIFSCVRIFMSFTVYIYLAIKWAAIHVQTLVLFHYYLKGKLFHRLQVTKQVCGVSSNHPWRKQTWWWNNQVEETVREKRRCFKLWKAGGSRAAYNTAKRTSNRAVHQARSEAEKIALQKIDPRSGDVYRLAKQMRRDNQDVMGEKPVKNDDAGQLSLDEEAKKEAWREHYERLLNVEFPWNPEDLSEESPVEGPSEPITLEMITKAISKMASGKAAGPSGIVAEMLKPAGEAGAMEVRDLIEDIISEGCIPTDWQESFIVNLYKGKGDALNRGNYRGLKLIEQVMKVLERVEEGLIRQRVEIDEMQCGFMSGRGTTDAIFIVRQLQEKHLAANKPLYMAFVDLEKASDRVPRDVIWWAMRKLGIDEWLVHLVQSMYKDVRSRVRVGDGYSEEFGVGVGVHQGSVLSPLLFIIVLRGSIQGVPHRLSVGAAVCRRPDDQCWVHGGTAGKGADMEDRDGEKGPTCEHGEDKDYGVWH